MRCVDENKMETLGVMYFAQTTPVHVFVTICVLVMFVGTKTVYDRLRRDMARLTVVVIGAGPIGLTSALIAALSGRATKIIIYEKDSRNELVDRVHQIAFEAKIVGFLKTHGVDFDNLEGCWQNCCFFTRTGIYLEYLLSVLARHEVRVETRLKTKVSLTLF
jgi:hypothetical protein